MTTTRVALVSGANRGIGLEVARHLSRAGIITVIGARDEAKGNEAAAELKAEGLDLAVVALDVSDQASARAAVAHVANLFGRLDILVNNAGVLFDGPSSGASVETVSPEVVTRTFQTNLMGPLYLTQAALPLMRSNKYGRIVNMSSGLGQLSDMGGGWPAYRMSKTALNALTRTTAAEVAADGIKVNAACPGWVKTDMGGPDAERTTEQGADTAVWLGLLPDDGPTGGFFRDRAPIVW
jgi:NAD(P)-dependent dehydrogenase (short-subunit alcohol dehydrogenase family)